jgi:glycosyltransferase involved in cell wall biosynthesis
LDDRGETLVSVIVPTHDRSGPLVRALDSVLGQTHGNVEVIVVDDGSNDDTREVVAGRYRDEPRVVYHWQQCAGVAGARNTGIEMASGDAVAFLDSDDAWQPWKLALQLECLERVPAAGLVWTNMQSVGPDGRPIPGSSLGSILNAYDRFPLDELFRERIPLAELSTTPDELRGGTLYAGDVYGKMIVGNLVLPSAALLTRERLALVERFDTSLVVAGEDFDFFLRTCREGVVAFADVPGVLYQVGQPDQLTHDTKQKYLARNYVRAIDAVIRRDPDRIDLPPATVRSIRAYGYGWAGRKYLEAGDTREARRYLRRAVRLAPGDPKTVALAAVSVLPGRLTARLLQAARAAVRRLRRS